MQERSSSGRAAVSKTAYPGSSPGGPAKWRHTQVVEEAGQVCPVGRSGLLRCEGSNPSGAPVAIFWYCLLF